MRKIIKSVAGLLISALLISLFSGCTEEKDDNKIKIIASNFPAYDFAGHIGGDLVDVEMLVKPGTGVHSFEPTPRDIVNICDSDLFVYAGGESEDWVDKILKSNGREVSAVKMTEAVTLYEEEAKEGMQSESDEGEEKEYDEHVWTAPENAICICEAIRDSLCAKYPEYKDVFVKNCDDYTEEIKKLDEDFKKVFEEVKSAKGEVTLIFGDRFPFLYFAKEYGLDYYAAFPGCSEETEANPKTIIFLQNKIKEKNIKAVFYIELSNDYLAKTLAESTNAEIKMIHSCHNVTAEEFEAGETYVSLMRRNLETLKEVL